MPCKAEEGTRLAPTTDDNAARCKIDRSHVCILNLIDYTISALKPATQLSLKAISS